MTDTPTGEQSPATMPDPEPEVRYVYVQRPTPSPRLGRVALIAGVALVVATVAASITIAIVGAPYADVGPRGVFFNFQVGDPNPVKSALGALGVAQFVIGTGVGLWVFVQSIVAIAMNRGRAPAIVALVLAILGPILMLAALLVTMLIATSGMR